MTTAERLQSVLDSKAAIKAAIIAKGVSCGDTLSDYPNRIAAIQTQKAEETKTVDITTNGTYNVTPSAANKVLSKVVVNANVPTVEYLNLAVTSSSADKDTSGLYEWQIEFHKDNETIALDELPEVFDLGINDLRNRVENILGYSLFTGTAEAGEISTNQVISNGKGLPFNIVLLKTGVDPSQGYASGILWYYPGTGNIIYGQNF